MDLAELRRQVAEMPSISALSAQLDAAFGITPANTVLVTPKSVGLSQADSGFGSPPFRVSIDDQDYDGDISGVELLDDSFEEDDPSISGWDGKSRVGPCVQACFVGCDSPPPLFELFHSNFRRRLLSGMLPWCWTWVFRACDSSSNCFSAVVNFGVNKLIWPLKHIPGNRCSGKSGKLGELRNMWRQEILGNWWELGKVRDKSWSWSCFGCPSVFAPCQYSLTPAVQLP